MIRTVLGTAVIVLTVALFIAEAVRESRTQEWKRFLWKEAHGGVDHFDAIIKILTDYYAAAWAALKPAVAQVTAAMQQFGEIVSKIAPQFQALGEQFEFYNEPNQSSFDDSERTAHPTQHMWNFEE